MITDQDVLQSSPAAPVYRYPVSEVYGPVCQGEGALIGRPTVFVRLGGCDYRCSWCDSLYAVLPEHRGTWRKMEARDIALAVSALYPLHSTYRHVTLSGGNPAIHPCGALIEALHSAGCVVNIETQGTINPDWLAQLDQITISPKPPSSGNITPLAGTLTDIVTDWRFRQSTDWQLPSACDPRALEPRRRQSLTLKVVVFDEQDYGYAKAVHAYFPNIPFYLQAGTEVGKASRDDLCDALTHWQEVVLTDPEMQDVSVLPQLHAILKGHARGI